VLRGEGGEGKGGRRRYRRSRNLIPRLLHLSSGIITDQVLEQFNLSVVADSQIGGGLFMTNGLSGGERKRLNTASALLTDPRIFLIDEPTSGME